ncbi:hypothetical protein CfE428DRAFT_0686 [Chthoniobacter flavus Ellin428]|uniref:Uncharacterized protein n=1 Tax=Chthoniobacter flavus Ellin428 TaxID=497964 RepID=B4CVJ9_9BACT|nr:ABC transporter permease [Chthoniobacter flavus]EDY21441.1 hypothetical protein CfE428DRAFT_0686 [Chthoniobacter flavus Ellin428]TCO95398.1 hypothetical protein EV701_10185 [Chthoniobacter flavus]
MSTLLWKELRENFKWALLAMFALGAAELLALYTEADADYSFNNGITLCHAAFLILTTFGPPAIGLLLGFLQILPELNRDRWAALLHRPISWGALFWAKAVAGVLLYIIAAVIPLLVCVWQTATPGHFASPFVPGLALAGIADTATGLAYYFAALLIALQGGRIAWRVLPLLAAVYLTSFVQRADDFSDAAWAVLGMTLVLSLAGWGAIYRRDRLRGRPWFGRLALFLVAFYGCCGFAEFALFVWKPDRWYNSDRPEYRVNEEGRPLKIIYRSGTIISVEELDGSAPSEAKYKRDRVRSHTVYLNEATAYIGDSHHYHPRVEHEQRYRLSHTYIVPAGTHHLPQPESWFLLRQPKILVGISLHRKTVAAILDLHGFQPPGNRPVPFPVDVVFDTVAHDRLLQFQRESLRVADFAGRSVTEIPLPASPPIHGVANAWNANELEQIEISAVALRGSLAIYDQKDWHLLATLPYHHDVERWGQISVGVNVAGDRFYLQYEPSVWIPWQESAVMPSYVDVMSRQGKVEHSYTLPPLPVTPAKPTPAGYLIEGLRSPVFFFGTLLYQKLGVLLGNQKLQDVFEARMGSNAHAVRETAVLILVCSLLCAGATLAGARRLHFSWSQAALWAGVALVFNIAGLLLFLTVADWPQVVPCATCQRPRPVSRQTCPHCADDWPPAAATGTEIFDHEALSFSSCPPGKYGDTL